jgi:hypothetical protein
VLSGNLTADNEFAAYISTTPGTLGTLVDYGSNWEQAYPLLPVTLAPNTTYYLHVIADNFYGPSDMSGGNPDALLASLSLTKNGGDVFSNGLTTLLSNTANWTADAYSSEQIYPNPPPPTNPVWVSPTDAPVMLATNGDVAAIWGQVNGGPVSGFPLDAQLIWSPQNPDPSGEAFFSTTISAAPEPATWAMLLLGFFGIGFMVRGARRKDDVAVA